MCSNAAQQPSAEHRLDQTLFGAQTLRLGQGTRVIPGGQDNNRGFCDSRIRPDFAKSPKTIDFGHQQIEQHEIDRFSLQGLEALICGLDRQNLKFASQEAGQDCARVLVVVHD